MNPLRLTPVVRAWVITLVAVFLAGQLAERLLDLDLTGVFGLVPQAVVLRGFVWQLFTYPFLHNDFVQLLLNGLMLAFLGSELEGLWGRRRFGLYALICSLSGGVFYLLLQVFFWGNQGLATPMLGASGAIYGLLAAYGLLFSERTLMFMMLFPMKAKHFVWVLAGVELFTSVSAGRNGLSAAAHLGGMAAGLGTLMLWARQSAQRRNPAVPKKGKRPGHLRLVVNKDTPQDKTGGPGRSGPTFH